MKEGGENRFGIASFVYGVLGIIHPLLVIISSISDYLGVYFRTYNLKLYIHLIISLILSILGIVFYFKQRKIKPTKLALAGLILSIIGLLLVLLTFFLSLLAKLHVPLFN